LELFQEPGGHGEFRLYGFLTEAEARVFELLRGVAGVGSKTALTILSATSVAELREYILQGDSRALQRLPGVGKKTAERLVVELRERIVQVEAEDVSGIPAAVRQEAVAALMALGYSRSEAERGIRDALLHALPDSLTAEALIKLALRCLQS
jgi:Holliday junction DNA helicase RuvA